MNWNTRQESLTLSTELPQAEACQKLNHYDPVTPYGVVPSVYQYLLPNNI